jgi:hypothetical protein
VWRGCRSRYRCSVSPPTGKSPTRSAGTTSSTGDCSLVSESHARCVAAPSSAESATLGQATSRQAKPPPPGAGAGAPSAAGPSAAGAGPPREQPQRAPGRQAEPEQRQRAVRERPARVLTERQEVRQVGDQWLR